MFDNKNSPPPSKSIVEEFKKRYRVDVKAKGEKHDYLQDALSRQRKRKGNGTGMSQQPKNGCPPRNQSFSDQFRKKKQFQKACVESRRRRGGARCLMEHPGSLTHSLQITPHTPAHLCVRTASASTHTRIVTFTGRRNVVKSKNRAHIILII